MVIIESKKLEVLDPRDRNARAASIGDTIQRIIGREDTMSRQTLLVTESY